MTLKENITYTNNKQKPIFNQIATIITKLTHVLAVASCK